MLFDRFYVTPGDKAAAWIAFVLLPSSVIAFQWYQSFFPAQSIWGAVGADRCGGVGAARGTSVRFREAPGSSETDHKKMTVCLRYFFRARRHLVYLSTTGRVPTYKQVRVVQEVMSDWPGGTAPPNQWFLDPWGVEAATGLPYFETDHEYQHVFSGHRGYDYGFFDTPQRDFRKPNAPKAFYWRARTHVVGVILPGSRYYTELATFEWGVTYQSGVLKKDLLRVSTQAPVRYIP